MAIPQIIALIVRLLAQQGAKEIIKSQVIKYLAKKSHKFAQLIKKIQQLKQLKQDISPHDLIPPSYLQKYMSDFPQKSQMNILKMLEDELNKGVKKELNNLKGLNIQKEEWDKWAHDKKATINDNNTLNNKVNNAKKRSLKDKIKEQEERRKKDEDNKWYNLSSSWVKAGSYKAKKDNNFGTLAIIIQCDNDKTHRVYGPYYFPLIERKTWNNMRVAIGKNGTGAGSVLWREYLRPYNSSNLKVEIQKYTTKKGYKTKNQLKSIPSHNSIMSELYTQQLKSISFIDTMINKRSLCKKTTIKGINKIDNPYYRVKLNNELIFNRQRLRNQLNLVNSSKPKTKNINNKFIKEAKNIHLQKKRVYKKRVKGIKTFKKTIRTIKKIANNVK